MKNVKTLCQNIKINPNYYQIPFNTGRANNKNLRQVLADLASDLEMLLVELPNEKNEELDNKIAALKELSCNKKINENRVRFWINLMSPDINNLVSKIS